MDEKTRDRITRFAPLVIVLTAVALVYGTGLNKYVSLHELRVRHIELKAFVADHYLLSLLAYTLLFAAITVTAIPGAVFVQFAGGFLFGAAVGGTATALGATAGAVVTYYVARSAFGDSLRKRAMAGDGLTKGWRAGLENNAFWFLLSLRIPPFMPFVIINALAGLAAVPVRAYALATFLGVWPSSVVWATIGQGLDRTFERGEPLRALDPFVVWPLVGLSLLSLVPTIVKLVRGRRAPPAV